MIKISKYQYDEDVLEHITFDDYHSAIEDAISIYEIEGQKYIVINILSLKEDDNSSANVVFEFNEAFKPLRLVKDERIVRFALKLYNNDN